MSYRILHQRYGLSHEDTDPCDICKEMASRHGMDWSRPWINTQPQGYPRHDRFLGYLASHSDHQRKIREGGLVDVGSMREAVDICEKERKHKEVRALEKQNLEVERLANEASDNKQELERFRFMEKQAKENPTALPDTAQIIEAK